MSHISKIVPPFPKPPAAPFYPPDRSRMLSDVAATMARRWVDECLNRSPALQRQYVLVRLMNEGVGDAFTLLSRHYFRTLLAFEWQVRYYDITKTDMGFIYDLQHGPVFYKETPTYRWMILWLHDEVRLLEQKLHIQRYRARHRSFIRPRPTRYVAQTESRMSIKASKGAIRLLRNLTMFQNRLRFASDNLMLSPKERCLHPLLRRLRKANAKTLGISSEYFV